MTLKMDVAGEMEVNSESLVQATNDVLECEAVDRTPDASHMIRERNLLLLSALYYLYGEEWKENPDWTRVSTTITNMKIPHYGDDFKPDSCERRYKSLMANGYEVGIGNVTAVLKPPKRLSEAQKRLWILSSTSDDLVRTSKLLDAKMRLEYKKEAKKLEKIEAGEYEMDPSELDLYDDIVPLEGEDEFKFEANDMEKFAAEASQTETLEKIVGMSDVVTLLKYCYNAVDYAVQKYPGLSAVRSPSSETTQSKTAEKVVEVSKSQSSNSDEGKDATPSLSADSSAAKPSTTIENDESKHSALKSATPSKLVESNVTVPEQPVLESSAISSQAPSTPSQNPARPSTRGSSRDRTPPVSDSKEDKVSESSKRKDNETASNSSKSAESLVKETNGKDSDLPASDTCCGDNPVPATEADSPNKKISAPVEIIESNAKIDNDIKDSSKGESTPVKMEVAEVTNPSPQSSTVTTDGPQQITSDTSCEPGSPKSRKGSPKKQSSSTPVCSSPASSRTSSRLPSPEPEVDNDKPKKSLSRQASGSDNTPTLGLRSRTGATPTKVNVVEKEAPKDTSSTNNVAAPPPEEEDSSENKFGTPRSTPDSPECKSDLESNLENRPKQPKVYTVKPPSPLSHVDPKLFELNDDEEDEELAAIDESINKSRSEKNSSKTYARRGRTVSSENASETNDESSQSKRSTRKQILQDETDEVHEGSGNSEDSAKKRLTRSSLKLHDAANDEGDITHTGSDRAASESSFSGKEKKSRQIKPGGRAKRLYDEKQRLYGETDLEETPEGKRVTRARAKTTSTSQPEKSKASAAAGDSEGLGDADNTPTRATRSRVSIVPSVPAPDVTSTPSTLGDEEENKAFRKTTLILLDKIIAHESATAIQKYFHDDPSKVIKKQLDFSGIKQKVESGKIKGPPGFQKDLTLLVTNTILAHPNSAPTKEVALNFLKWIKTCLEETKGSRVSSLQKADNSDVESLESHDDSRSETASKSSGVGRRKRKRSASETSEELGENKRRITRTSATVLQQQVRKPKHPISPDIVSANRLHRMQPKSTPLSPDITSFKRGRLQ